MMFDNSSLSFKNLLKNLIVWDLFVAYFSSIYYSLPPIYINLWKFLLLRGLSATGYIIKLFLIFCLLYSWIFSSDLFAVHRCCIRPIISSLLSQLSSRNIDFPFKTLFRSSVTIDSFTSLIGFKLWVKSIVEFNLFYLPSSDEGWGLVSLKLWWLVIFPFRRRYWGSSRGADPCLNVHI